MIPLSALPDRPYAVLGLGKSGLAAAQALQAAGKTVWAWDDDGTTRQRANRAGVPIVDLTAADLSRAADLILSPGIPHTFPRPHPVVTRARQAGCRITGDGELLASARPDAQFIGITGTNGKSTTTALIGHILSRANRECAVGGNLGTPVLALDPLSPTGTYVLEMSSYQLELTPNLVFNCGVLINISPDHLERHGGMEGYIAAKRSIFRGWRTSATAVIGVDDAPCRQIAAAILADGMRRLLPISCEVEVPGGIFRRGRRLMDGSEGSPQAVLDLDAAPALPGTHNAQNAAAAYAAARAVGIAPEAAAQAILSFPGLKHRQERIAVIDGTLFVNDSKATNADAAAKALACYDAIYWIAGGRPKESGLEGIDPWLPRVRRAFLIGEAEAQFAQALKDKVAVHRCGTLDCAVAEAAEAAAAEGRPGRVVLLSPACASFDQFANFEARGDAFRRLVEGLRR